MHADTRLLSSSKLIDSSKRFIFFLIAFFSITCKNLQANLHMTSLERIPEYENMHELHLNVMKSNHLCHFHLFAFKIARYNKLRLLNSS